MTDTSDSPLHERLEAAGAQFRDHRGRTVAAQYSAVEEEVRAARSGAIVADRNDRALLTVAGPDAARFLHGMVTNEVQGLSPGAGNYSCHLNVQGQIQADFHLLAMPDHFLLDTDVSAADSLRAALEKYIIADKVEVAGVSDRLCSLSVLGPASAKLLTAAGAAPLPAEEYSHAWMEIGGTPALIVRLNEIGEPGYRVICTTENAGGVWDALLAQQEATGWKPAGFDALNVLRTEAGIPWPGAELTDKTLPPEARLESNAVNYDKGCYIGQEIVERIRSRGNVNRLLTGFLVECDSLPAHGTKLLHDGKDIGWITTALDSPTLKRKVALGYLRREQSAEGNRLSFEGGTAEVTALPFYRREA